MPVLGVVESNAVFSIVCSVLLCVLEQPRVENYNTQDFDFFKIHLSTTEAGGRWRWIGHVLRKNEKDLTKTALFWTPEGKRRRGRPRITWWHTIEAEMNKLNHSWGSLQKMAKDRQKWRTFVAAPHAIWRNGQ